MCKVCINGKVYFAHHGEKLSSVLQKNGVHAEHPCGGKGTCKKCLVTVNGKEELSCQYTIESDISVFLPEYGKISSEVGADETGRITDNICFALDLGTTTLALAMVSLDEKRIIATATCTNPQQLFGADVMSRIEYCGNNGSEELQSAVVKAVDGLLTELGNADGKKLYVAGNTVMLHLLLGVDCSSMGVSPYTPVFLNSRIVRGEDIGLDYIDEIETLPSIAAFVGADITAGLNFVPPPPTGKFNLLVDLGTNAEIVLFSQSSALCTSASAGPCFEGAGISCGMSAVSGAVYAFENGEALTIDNHPAKGICATGLVDIIAYLIYSKKIDETGLMDCESFFIADSVYISQKDVRQFQLAKSAVCSGIDALLTIKGITFDDIENLYVSGGFSSGMNIGNAAVTGLIPDALKEKGKAVKNSSLLGAVRYACEKKPLLLHMNNSRYVDLSSLPLFQKSFIKNINF